jgi:ribonucrease Y
MPFSLEGVLLLCLVAFVSVALGVLISAKLVGGGRTAREEASRKLETSAELRADEIKRRAEDEAQRRIKEAELEIKEALFQKKEEFNREVERSRMEIREQERRLEKREDSVEQLSQGITQRERQLEVAQKRLAEKREILDRKIESVEQVYVDQLSKLQEITHLPRDQAEKLLFERLEHELSDEMARRIQRADERLREQSEAKARGVIALAIQRYAAQHTADTTVSTVDIPSDDMKGRIIGREGRNIRTFEKITGVDVIVDDTPGVVIVSAFDNVRRETARIALNKLILDGRIHPTRIEEVVLETQQEMDKNILDIGRQAVLDADIGTVHEKLLYLLGRLKFRTSYSQNVLQHSLEVAHLTGMMAAELGLDQRLARRCALLHDIGKAADHEMEGGHPKIGADLAKRYGETSKEVLHAIAGHHDDVGLDNIYTVLVAASDAISASRPGARRETLEKYVKRLEELETLACGFPGVENAYAIQAGRELRVIANSHQTDDSKAIQVCRDIARAIEEQLDYPGEIKVTIVREMRFVETAK